MWETISLEPKAERESSDPACRFAKGYTALDYDQKLKLLVVLFFREFLELFFPQFAAEIDWTRPLEFLDKELQTIVPKAARKTVDVLVKAHTRRAVEAGGHTRGVLLHIELEANASRRQLARRMFRYFSRGLDWFNLPIIPIAVYLQVAGDGLGWQAFALTYWEHTIVRFEFPYVGLPGLDGESFLDTDNPLAWALTAFMRIAPERRAGANAESLRRVALARLDHKRQRVLVECLEAFTPLDHRQQREYEQLVASEPFQETQHVIKTIFDEAEERGIEKGREQGRHELLLLQLEQKFGPLSQRVRTRIERLTEAESRALARKLLSAQSIKELGM